MLRLNIAPPHVDVPDPENTVTFTMWESTRIGPVAVANCNAVRAVIVPCPDNALWFRASGVTSPIHVVPLGFDHASYHPGQRFATPRPAGPVRFGCAGRTAHDRTRKGLDVVVAAFLAAFPDSADARATLDVKCWPDCQVTDPGDPRVRILRTPLSEVDLAAWYRSLDAFASASRGEGWGLQPLQAMACGTPTIAPLWGGHAAYMTPGTGYPVAHDERPAEGDVYAGLGNWCVPRPASIAARLAEVVADPAEARRRGEVAARRAAEFSWGRTAREVDAILYPPSAPPLHGATVPA